MKKKFANVNFDLCRPGLCASLHQGCAAVEACSHGLLEQETEGEAPVLLSQSLCVGCGRCARSCRFAAVDMS